MSRVHKPIARQTRTKNWKCRHTCHLQSTTANSSTSISRVNAPLNTL